MLFPPQYAGQVHAEYEGFFFTRAFSGVCVVSKRYSCPPQKIIPVDRKSANRIHSSRLLGDGQVMIDVKGYRRTNPALDSWSCADFCNLLTRLITRLTDSTALFSV